MEQYTYTIKCRLGGEYVVGDTTEEPEAEAATVDAARDLAIERLHEELTELMVRGTFDEFEGAFEVVDGNPVREAWDALGTAIVEKGDWRAAMQDAYQILSDYLGIEQEVEG